MKRIVTEEPEVIGLLKMIKKLSFLFPRFYPLGIIIPLSLLLQSCNEDVNISVEIESAETKKVLIHYMPWFSETGRHWEYGTVNEPLIGYYDSTSWATHLYHILLSSTAGIDGAMINVRSDYNQAAFEAFIHSLQRITNIDNEFDYSVSISYDDQDMTYDVAEENMIYLRDNILTTHSNYLYKDGKPVIFIWNYEGYLSSSEYRTIADIIFDDPILIKNEIDPDADSESIAMNSFYPWAQGFSDDGQGWGEDYLNWFYTTSKHFLDTNKQDFIVGAVWPGFDDRDCSWGQDRWIDRRSGELYQDTWDIISNYNNSWSSSSSLESNSTSSDSVNWVIIETWNDFNEGTEIEPIKSDEESEQFQYLISTATNIANYKGTASKIDEEGYMLSSSVVIYEAAKLIEDGHRNSDTFYPILQNAIQSYLQNEGEEAQQLAQNIIDNITT